VQQLVDWAYHQIGSTVKKSPQIILFIMNTKDAFNYETLKRRADCGAGVVTQMVQASHVRKNQDQYHSNIAMKVNAKLGGKTSCAVGGPKPPGGSCIIGVDVSHAAPGVEKSSMASMCMSMDQNYTYYQGRVQTNGWRVEILERKTIETMLTPMLVSWMADNGNRAPLQIFYFRDGVAEGQFVHVLEYEIKVLEEVFQKVTKAPPPKITVIIATKRHHIRFFPERGDRNGNPMPGTLLDREVTHPFHYDFYLCSHVAIQGTARPVHYTVIRDDIKMKPDDLQKMIYHQCYQYARSTTPVSLHPAVYYAHLAGNRGRPHEQEPPVESKDKKTETSKNKNPPLLVTELASRGRDDITKKWFREAMWYI
jgi:eukaryotic translation initiation factor 2C